MTLHKKFSFLLFAIVTSSIPAFSQWTPDVSLNTPVCLANGMQLLPAIVSDGAGGAIIAWQDERDGNWDIYAQRLDAAGNRLWPTNGGNGIVICDAPDDQILPRLISDNASGAIIAWRDRRNGTDDDVYIHHVDHNGILDVAWGANGRLVCNATGNQGPPELLSDGVGGVILTWEDRRNNPYYDIYAHRVLTSGIVDPAWPSNGVPISVGTSYAYNPRIVSDGSGGTIITWYEYRGGPADIYAAHVTSTGITDWTANGVPISSATGDQLSPTLVPDGAGGAIITWYDYRDAIVTHADIYAHHVLPSGTVDPTWTSSGVPICTAPRDQLFPVITGDGLGGAIIVWADKDDDVSKISAQRINSAGEIQWSTNGITISGTITYQGVFAPQPAIVSDNTNGAVVVWAGKPSGSSTDRDIHAQQINMNGTSLWENEDMIVSNAQGPRSWPALSFDPGGFAIFTWQDNRAGWDIYAQKKTIIGGPSRCLTPPPSGMVGWWPSDQHSFDISGQENHGVIYGGVTYGSPGMVDDAFTFNGIDGYIEVPHSNSLDIGTGDFSFDAWVKTTLNSFNAVAIQDKRLGGSGPGYHVYLYNGELGIQLADGESFPGYTNYNSNYSIADGAWHHIAITVERASATGLKFYVDGTIVSTQNPTARSGSLSNSSVLRIGSRSFSVTGLFPGSLDEIELFNRALEASEIQAIYNAGSFGKCKPACSPRPGSVDVAVQAGWNMLTVPVSNPIPDNQVSSLFPGARSPAFTYDNGYENQNTVSSCDGFWLRFANAATITITGNLLCELSCPLKRGWNLIGGISVPVEVNKLKTIPPGRIVSRFFGLASGGGYETSTTLEPGKGYWVNLSDDAKLIISAYGLLQKVANTDPTDVLRSYNNLTVTDGAGRGQTLYFGKYPSENPSVEYFSIPPIPPDGVFDVRFQSDRMVEVYGSAGSSERYRVTVRSAAYPLTLSLRMANGNKERVTVTNGLGGKLLHSTELGNGGTVTVINPEVTSLLITVNKESAVPTNFALYPAYPNPFNPTTQISFDLPKASQVSLKVYDLLGREVATLIDKQEYEAGAHETVFDAGHFSSGIYVYRLTAQSEGSTFTDVKKMVLVR